MFSKVFNFIDEVRTYEERVVAYFDDGNLRVSTVAVNDGNLPFETGVGHSEYNDGNWVIVGAYRTRADAAFGHKGWIKTMTDDELPEYLLDIANSEIAQKLVAQGGNMVFPRKNRKIQ